MAQILPFQALRTESSRVESFSATAYDSESREADGTESLLDASYLKVLHPQWFASRPLESDEKFKLGREAWQKMVSDGVLIREEKPAIYIYRQVKGNNLYTSLIGLASIEDYSNAFIKKHELTRTEKESSIADYFREVRVNGSPVLLTYTPHPKLEVLMADLVEAAPMYHFTAVDGIEHMLWRVSEEKEIEEIRNYFSQIDALYIADGHHRCAAIALLYPEVKEFMACFIPADQLNIHGFHRYVRDLNGMSPEEMIAAIAEHFPVKKLAAYEPVQHPHTVHVFVGQAWYAIEIPEKLRSSPNPKQNLDVYVLDNEIFGKILGIADTRTSDRIRFINGEVKTEQLLLPVLNGEMQAVFMLYPVRVEEVIEVSEHGETMPPKSTWIEPKMRSGLLVHNF